MKMTERNIEEVLALEAAEFEESRGRDEPKRPLFRSKQLPRDPAQVYSVRMPVDRLEELRQAALVVGETPSGLMRRWVLERLDQEAENPPTEFDRILVLVEALEQAVDRARQRRTVAGLPAIRRALEEALREAS
jgi:hypothetical protein